MVSEIGKVTVQPLATSVRAASVPSANMAPVAASTPLADASFLAPRLAAVSGDRELQAQRAGQIREAQAAIEAIRGRLGGIEKTLVQIVKQYPPYPLDNPQRVLMLNQVQGLRKELDALTVPAPYRFPSEQVKLPQTEAGPLPTPVVVAREYVALPSLDPQKASDEEVASALEQIQALHKNIEQAAERMWQDVVGFVGKADPSQAEDQSRSVRGYLAGTPGVTIAHGNDRVLAAAVSAD